MSTITISKKEYERLADAKLCFDYLRTVFEANSFSPPPTRNKTKIAAAMRATGKYNRQFLASIRRGLRRSSYFK